MVAQVYPREESLGAFAASASAATLTPSLPTVTANANGLLLAVLCTKNNATHATATTGWNRIGPQVNSGASFSASLWAAPQGSAAPVFTWTGAVACSAQVGYYTDPNSPLDAAGVALLGAVGTGSTTTHATAGGNTTRDKTAAVYVDVCAANTAMATPSGWTEDADAGSATSATRHVWGEKPILTSGSASGAISVTGGNAAWVQFQVQISDTQATNLQVSKLDAFAALEPKAGLSVSKEQVFAWLEPNDFRVSKLDVYAWLDPSPAGGRRMSLM